MVSRNRRDPKPDGTISRRRATTPEGRENQLIAIAIDAIEKRILAGTASAQELVHFAKLGSSREQMEQDRLSRENELLTAKVENLESAKNIEKLYSEAIAAMRSYQGQSPIVHDDEE